MSDAQPTLTSLPQILASRERVSAPQVRFSVPADWLQGRTTFGGLLSALAVQAMRDVCGSNWPLRALQTNFVGPVAVGHFDVEVTLLRQGKNIRQVQARVLQSQADGQPQVCGVLLGVFGTGRESALPFIRPAQPTVQRTAEQAAVWPYIPDVMPAFTQHLEFRHAEGGVPFSGSRDAYSRTYTRLKVAEGVDAELLSVLLADAGPTPALAMLPGFAPASSVSWALELRPVGDIDAQGLWRMDKDAIATGEGYVNETTTLWTPCGQMAALGYQVVAVYG
ncbi:thioesterase family protein [Aquabacterium sp. A3]|uniref:acyl-CoA thioesterase n=1 Tax=Aquabacterium sp. A3 TaxID=3132829 RepID=UPI0031194FD2